MKHCLLPALILCLLLSLTSCLRDSDQSPDVSVVTPGSSSQTTADEIASDTSANGSDIIANDTIVNDITTPDTVDTATESITPTPIDTTTESIAPAPVETTNETTVKSVAPSSIDTTDAAVAPAPAETTITAFESEKTILPELPDISETTSDTSFDETLISPPEETTGEAIDDSTYDTIEAVDSTEAETFEAVIFEPETTAAETIHEPEESTWDWFAPPSSIETTAITEPIPDESTREEATVLPELPSETSPNTNMETETQPPSDATPEDTIDSERTIILPEIDY